MKLSELHTGSLTPKGACVAKSPAGNSLRKPLPVKPDLTPIDNRILQANDMARTTSMADVSRIDAPPV
jgi:hypothetical protein